MARPLKPFGSGRKYMKGNQRFSQLPTRLQMQAANTLGIIMKDAVGKGDLVRSQDLDLYDRYFANTQYDDLKDWDSSTARDGEYTPVRERKPRVIYNVAKVLVNKVTSKLFGSSTFPTFVVEEDPDDTQYFHVVQQACGFRRNLIEVGRHTLLNGSCFCRYYMVNGSVQMEWYRSKYCYPTFDALGELALLEVKYVFEDPNDKTADGKFRRKWFRLVLGTESDILYDNPEYRENADPVFKVVEQNDHKLGWVQGEWFRTSKHKHDPDGDSLIGDILSFIDELNYSLSQSSQAVAYNQDPQLAFNKMDEDELESLIRSSEKAWNLGREGEAKFVESDLKGVEMAEATRDHMRHRMLEVVRIVLQDPEKDVQNAQSGEALKQLNAPLVELIDDLRAVIEPSLKNLLTKIGMTIFEMDAQGFETTVQLDPKYKPKSFELSVNWPAVFPPTLQDIQLMATAAQTVAMANLISRESLTRWLAPVFNVDNIDEELQKISAQPILNPFGSFDGGGQ